MVVRGEKKKPTKKTVVGEVQSLFPLWYPHSKKKKKLYEKLLPGGLPKYWNFAEVFPPAHRTSPPLGPAFKGWVWGNKCSARRARLPRTAGRAAGINLLAPRRNPGKLFARLTRCWFLVFFFLNFPWKFSLNWAPLRGQIGQEKFKCYHFGFSSSGAEHRCLEGPSCPCKNGGFVCITLQRAE